jgi:hypothetical protein
LECDNLQLNPAATARDHEWPKGAGVFVVEQIEPLIMLARGQKVILDVDLAKLYGVTT